MDNAFGLLGVLNSPTTAALFAQKGRAAGDADAGAGMMALCCGIVPLIVIGLMMVIFVVAGWKIFTKAGRPGWEAIVPIYSHWILVTEICKKEPLWFFLAFVPIGNIIAAWVICQELAKKFGKSEAFGMGLFFLGPIFVLMLAFGDAKYQGRKSASSYDDEDEDEDDRPRRSSRDDDDDDDDDDRPRRRR